MEIVDRIKTRRLGLSQVRVIVLLLLVFLISVASPLRPASAAPGAVLAVSPPHSTGQVGEIFEVGITVKNVTDLYWYNLTLLYDTTILDVFNATLQSTWFNTSSTPYDQIRLETDESLGSVQVEVRIAGSFPGLTGEGTLLFINFLVSTKGTSTLSLDETTAFLRDSQFNPILHTTIDGTFSTFSNIIKNHSFEQGLDATGEKLVFDTNSDGQVDSGDQVVSVTPPRSPTATELGKPLLTDAKVKFIDADSSAFYSFGEVILFDADSNGLVSSGDHVVNLTPPRAPSPSELGEPLAADSQIRFIEGSSNFNGIYDPGNPLFWRLDTFEGVENATVRVDVAPRITDGDHSAQVFTGPIICKPTPCPGRPIGFTQFYQTLPLGTTFANLTDNPSSFSFWFYLDPYGSSLGDFRVRMFGAEGIAELDYVFDADPAVSYSNQTGSRYLLLQGYSAGQWHYFSRNLRADWVSVGFNLDFSLSRVQFEGLAFQPPLKSETFWLDDVRMFAGPVAVGNQPPKVSFTVQPPAPKYLAGDQLTFNSSTTYDPDPDGSIASYQWDFGDGTPLTVLSNPIVQHSYDRSGIFRVTLTAFDNLGLSNAASRAVIINTPPPCPSCPIARLTFSPEHALVGMDVLFNGTTSSDPESQPLEYSWNLGDGNTRTGSTVTYAYASPGTYYVTLTVKDQQDLTGTTLTTVTVSTLDAGIMRTIILVPLIRGQSDQTISASVINVGNVEAYAYISLTVLFDRQGTSTQYNSTVQRLDVRATYDLSVTFTQPQERGRRLVILTLFVSMDPPTGGTEWTAWESTALAYRVMG